MMQLAIFSNSSAWLTSNPSCLSGSDDGARRQELRLRRPQRRGAVVTQAGRDLRAGFEAGSDERRQLVGREAGVRAGDADPRDGIAIPEIGRASCRDSV